MRFGPQHPPIDTRIEPSNSDQCLMRMHLIARMTSRLPVPKLTRRAGGQHGLVDAPSLSATLASWVYLVYAS